MNGEGATNCKKMRKNAKKVVFLQKMLLQWGLTLVYNVVAGEIPTDKQMTPVILLCLLFLRGS